MLTEYAVLDEQWAVRIPEHLTWEEAATLPCAGVTAWNSLVGPEPVVAGQTVLTLGTGGVSLFAIQFAKLFGCRVISLTSSEAKFDKLRALGADHVLNYAATPEWGEAVRALTGGEGVDRVIETFGPDTIEQSMRASALHGHIVLLITRSPTRPGIEISGGAWASSLTTIRRVFVGSRASFEAMNRAIVAARLRPVIDRGARLRGSARSVPLLHAGQGLWQGRHPEGISMNQFSDLIDRYVSAWHETDPDARRQRIATLDPIQFPIGSLDEAVHRQAAMIFLNVKCPFKSVIVGRATGRP